MPIRHLQAVVESANYRYKRYAVPKKDGGERLIAHPSRQLKALQRWLVRNVFNILDVHQSATAYRSGLSILDNAMVHVANNYLLKLDFTNFFPSITQEDIESLLSSYIGRSEILRTTEDAVIIGKIVSLHGRLTIGAPSSPTLANAIMFEFDDIISRKSAELGIAYSRYADDLVFSTRVAGLLTGHVELVREVLQNIRRPRVTLNRDKTVHASKKRKRLVTGVSLTSEGKISLGRKRKRRARSLLHKFILAQSSIEEAEYIRGFLSYAKSIEPEFQVRLERKYGSAALERVMRVRHT